MIIPQYQYNPADFPVPSAPAPSQAVTPAVVNPYLLKIQVPENFLKDRVRELNLEKFMRSSLPDSYYLLLLLPVIGWIALAHLKYTYNQYQSKAERELIREGISEEVRLKNAVRVSGPLAWQYRMELARHYLLQDRFQEALKALQQIPHANEVRWVWHTHSTLTAGREHIVLENSSQKTKSNILFSEDIVTFTPPQGGVTYSDHEKVMPLRTHNFEEAFMTTLAYAGMAALEPNESLNPYLLFAYRTWNEAFYYLEHAKGPITRTPVNENCNFSKFRFALSQLIKPKGERFYSNQTEAIVRLEDSGLPDVLKGNREFRMEHNFWPLNQARPS